jgi:iron complex transport system permease protein
MGDASAKFRIGFLVLAAVFVVVFFASFWMGKYPVAPLDLVRIIACWIQEGLSVLTGQAYSWPTDIDPQSVTAVIQLRLPRVVSAVFIGAALSIAGASYQGLFQNPMVSQDILGASSGAAFGAALAMILALNASGITILSFIFGLVAVLVSYLISKASKVSTILALILAGMVVSSLFTSATSFIKLVADTDDVLPKITYWLMGSLNTVYLDDLWSVALIFAAALPLIALRWRINLLATGEEEARSMGLNTQAMRICIIGCATLLTATCISVSGMIGWVGLIIPHFSRLVFGYDYRRIIPASILMGATFLLVVDDVARLATTSEIPIGILTAVIGAPVFIFLIMRGGGGARRGSTS